MMFCGKHQYIATVHQIKVLHGVLLISRFFRLNSRYIRDDSEVDVCFSFWTL